MKLVGFLCNWCSYEASMGAGGRRLPIPSDIVFVRVMCSGMVNPQAVLAAFADGADGVLILGCHPGPNPASFVSGVGAKSMIPAYGMNRADGSYIPGGIASGTALIRPDFPELLEWPFLWQQGEYCLGYPTSDYVFLILAADRLKRN